MTGQEITLRFRLDALGDNTQAEVSRQRQRRSADRRIVLVRLDVTHEGAIQLERVDRQHLQVRQRGITGAEIVDGQFDAAVAQGAQLADGAFRIFHGHRFGDFKLQFARERPKCVMAACTWLTRSGERN